MLFLVLIIPVHTLHIHNRGFIICAFFQLQYFYAILFQYLLNSKTRKASEIIWFFMFLKTKWYSEGI